MPRLCRCIPGTFRAVAPSLPLTAVFFWTLSRPDLVPATAVFAIELLSDVLNSLPIGIGAAMLVNYPAIVTTWRPFSPASRSASSGWASLWCRRRTAGRLAVDLLLLHGGDHPEADRAADLHHPSASSRYFAGCCCAARWCCRNRLNVVTRDGEQQRQFTRRALLLGSGQVSAAGSAGRAASTCRWWRAGAT
ncbi:MAG: hypothetical protein U1E33_04080 [Rhodospirillales bacterium]